MSGIDNVFTAAEATKLWGLADSTIRRAYMEGRFREDEAKKSKGTIMVTRAGMERLYGEIKE